MSRNVELVVELPEMDSIIFNQTDVEPDIVTSDVAAYWRDKSPVEDDLLTTRVVTKLYLSTSKMRSSSLNMMMT